MSHMFHVMANTQWPRTLLAIGFVTILVAVAIGAATDGSPVAQYVALAGLPPIGVGAVTLIAQRLVQFRDARRLSSSR